MKRLNFSWLDERVGKTNVTKVEIVKVGYPKFTKIWPEGVTENRGSEVSWPNCILLRVLKPIRVYKKVWMFSSVQSSALYSDDEIITLTLIPDSLIWVYRHTPKSRANYAYVNKFTSEKKMKRVSIHDVTFRYQEDSFITPLGRSFSTKLDRDECNPGIHFYFQRKFL